jgi:hypothetical protein
MPNTRHQQEGDRQHQRDRQGDDGAGAHAEAEEGNRQDDQDRFGQRRHEEVHRLANDLRLIGDDVNVDAQRQLLLQTFGFCTQAVAELITSPPLFMAMAMPIASWPWTRMRGVGGSAKPR